MPPATTYCSRKDSTHVQLVLALRDSVLGVDGEVDVAAGVRQAQAQRHLRAALHRLRPLGRGVAPARLLHHVDRRRQAVDRHLHVRTHF